MPGKRPTAVICLSALHGGMEMDAFRLATALSPHVPVTLIAKEGAPLAAHYRDEAATHGISLETIRFRTFFSPSLITAARRIVTRHGIRNVIFFGASELRSLYFSFLGLPINLIVRHGTRKTTPKKDPFHRLIYSNVRWHVAICDFLARNVHDIIPFGRQSQLRIIYSSLRYIPERLPAPTLRREGPIRLLHVGRIASGKGQIDAVRACEVLHQDGVDFRLDLVGDICPAHAPEFYRALDSAPYKNAIHVHGFTTNIPEFLREADIFLFPSKGEGLSNSFIEALAHGLLCIAYSNTSFPELRGLGFDFLMAEDQDHSDLKSILRIAINQLSITPLPIHHNIELARRLFNPAREIDEFLDLLV